VETLVVIQSCSEVVQVDRVTLSWTRSVPAVAFDSEARVREVAARVDPRARIADKDPALYRFLEKHPTYWNILAEAQEEFQRP
jgi:hypothetical protein